jgi:dethiobiotin synthetase
MSGFFITGTDTGVGKTFFTKGLTTALRRRGMRVGVMKPVETGCGPSEKRHPTDALALATAAGNDFDVSLVCPYQFEAPLAPEVAARLEGQEIDSQIILTAYQSMSRQCDLTLVEGAGGLMVPIARSYTMADLVDDLKIPILLVVDSKLGAVNHTLLTLETAASRDLKVRGYVLNHASPTADLASETNAELLSRYTDIACLGSIPWQPDHDATEIIDNAIDWNRLLKPER